MSEASRSNKQPLILIVDPAPAFRVMAEETLAQLGAVTLEAADGATGLRLLEHERVDLVLLHTQLPGRDGFEICEEIRGRFPDAELPVLMVTERDDVDSIRRAYEVGATDFVTKPINWLLLTHRVRYMLRMHEVLGEYLRAQQRLTSAQGIAKLGSWEYDPSSGVLACSDELRRLAGLPAGEEAVDAAKLLARLPEADHELVQASIRAAFRDGRGFSIDHHVLGPEATTTLVHTQAEILLDTDGVPAQLRGTSQDISDRDRAEAQIRFLAYHDSLTRLGNRRLFRDRVEQALAQAPRRGTGLGIMLLDLDHFKRINDTFGHELGDLLLREVAARLSNCVRGGDCVSRADDSPQAPTVSRLGGDEFMVLLSDVRDSEDAARVAGRILHLMAEPFALADHELVISASLGITLAPQDGDNVDRLLRNADAAMYHAKDAGRGNYKFYEPSMNETAGQSLKLETALRRALEREELHLEYQPKVDLASDRITGFEALLRWEHPEMGRVPPNEFIPVAERGGLIVPIGEFVLRSACQQGVRWREQGLGPLRVAVNLSAHQFKSEALADDIARILAQTGLPARYLEVEITESTLMENESVAVRALEQLRRIGVKVAMDDFGTGYSSLSYLRRFPVDTLKIDRSFVSDLATESDADALAATIISLGQALKLEVVAEGVETEEQREILRGHGCDEIQGYLVSRPVPAPEATALLLKSRGR